MEAFVVMVFELSFIDVSIGAHPDAESIENVGNISFSRSRVVKIFLFSSKYSLKALPFPTREEMEF
jgi:hypothetical protein